MAAFVHSLRKTFHGGPITILSPHVTGNNILVVHDDRPRESAVCCMSIEPLLTAKQAFQLVVKKPPSTFLELMTAGRHPATLTDTVFSPSNLWHVTLLSVHCHCTGGIRGATALHQYQEHHWYLLEGRTMLPNACEQGYHRP